MKTFETTTINTAAFFNLTLKQPLKFIGALFILVFIFYLAKADSKTETIYPIKNLPYSILLAIKATFYGYLFVLVFFYDFSISHFVWKFPQTVSLNSAFVGILSAYEAITGIIGSFQSLFRE